MFVDNICLLTKGKISSAQHLRETINNIAMNMHTTTDASPLTECKRYLDGVNFNKPPLLIHELGGRFDRVTQRVQFLKDFKQAVTDYTKSKFQPKTRFVVDEKFSQESDPIKDMGIGMLALRKVFMKELNAFQKEVKHQYGPFEQRGGLDGFDIVETELNKDENTFNPKAIAKLLKKEIKGWHEVEKYLDRTEHVLGVVQGLEMVLGFVESFIREHSM
jgi:hypothetical protein